MVRDLGDVAAFGAALASDARHVIAGRARCLLSTMRLVDGPACISRTAVGTLAVIPRYPQVD
jgi:hypothetical protein